MSNLEHLIENTLCRIEKDYDDKVYRSYEDQLAAIKSDTNFEEAGITAEQCSEICDYIFYTYIPYTYFHGVIPRKGQEFDVPEEEDNG